MKALLFSVLISMSASQVARIDEAGSKRMMELMPVIYKVADRHALPAWVIAGIIYNESNAHHAIKGDGGRAWGLGQIHCGPKGFSWLNFLKQRGIISSCKELLVGANSVAAIGEILSYLRVKEMKKRKLEWYNVTTSYHKGEAWRRNKLGVAKSYYGNVQYFGQYFQFMTLEGDNG